MIKDWLSIITSSISLLGVMFLVYHFFRNPDIKAEKDISLLKQGCKLTHNNLDNQILQINNRFERIENNHINHIEKDIRDINNTQTKILTILETKYKIKINDN
jgi:hypothetical protein